ncbi:hypothetical protein EHV15_34085 [Paenibacillus oralis]|uniref:Uncharacterized protein n=1 Tax=Paenibacillus oralis TaxID=2490856 RepID=A0A3P3TBY8_9BACL|nr:hypothetical protein [Paenibacillus oralis]RRJ54628.1 hypothetical protein EHV15_34085 [Paenibacillus oralis]
MATLELSYSEIMESNVTGIHATIYDDSGRIVARFRNFDPEAGETYGNQADSFFIPSVETGLAMMRSNKGYHQIPLKEEDLEQNSNIFGVSFTTDQVQISILSSMGLVTAQLETEESYPGIQILVDGNLSSVVECCEDEGRLMIRNYVESHDVPVSVNVKTADISIPKDWPAEIKSV